MATKLLDYSFDRPNPNTIKANGFDGVIRYLAPISDGGKVLTKGEVQSLQAAGLAIGLVWESYSGRALDGLSAGVADAKTALQQATALGVPDSVPIFFAVDFDATPEQQTAINAYFDGIAMVIHSDDIGMYGGFWPMSRAFDAGKIKWGWQTYAWSGGNWDPRAQLRQTDNGQWNGQVDYDEDEQGLAGLWVVNNQSKEEPMSPDDIKQMAQVLGFTPSQDEINKWSNSSLFPTFKDAMEDMVKQYPKNLSYRQVIDNLSSQLSIAQADKNSLLAKLTSQNLAIADLQRRVAAANQDVGLFSWLAQYNKTIVGLAGVVIMVLTQIYGLNNPIVQGVIGVLTVFGIHAVPNKEA